MLFVYISTFCIFKIHGDTVTSSLEIRCGILKRNKSELFFLDKCNISSASIQKAYHLDAGQKLCILTHGNLEKNNSKLKKKLGRHICIEGEYQGLGQFKLNRLLPEKKIILLNK